MAMREDVGLSWILTVSIPVLVIGVGIVVSRMVPQFRKMQERIDDVNRVLREQITGIRVVRAFVREPAEASASATSTMSSPTPRCAPAGCRRSCSRS